VNIEHLITPFKLGKPVLEPTGIEGSFRSHAVDCPTVFRHNNSFYMMYVGFDGKGYQTGLAYSDDLVNWNDLGSILKRGTNQKWDSVGMAGTSLLMDNDLYGPKTLKKYNGKYWMAYHAYPDYGYEAGSASIGLCYTEDESLMTWNFVGEPVFSYKDGGAWEIGGLYKCWIMEHDELFYLFYNAKNQDNKEGLWIEQTGMATSSDLLNWTRCDKNPILPVTSGAWDSMFASDPMVAYDSKEKQWVMFYFGLGNCSACEGIAVSDDLIKWEKFPSAILTIGGEGTVDSIYAHKPAVIYHDGSLYHFYCSCRPSKKGDIAENFGMFRCITVARTHPWPEQ
jgi:predicted GH43/DUF377 family glycosyl hydrolase